MKNSQNVAPTVLDIPADLAEKVRREDEKVVNTFNARIIELSKNFNERETAKMCGVSIDYVRKIGRKHKLVFADAKARTKAEQSVLSKEFKVHRAATVVREVAPKKPLKEGELKVDAKTALEGCKGLWNREKRFYRTVLEHSRTMTFRETCKILGVTPRFLRNFCYENDIEFAGYANNSTAGLDLFDLEQVNLQPAKTNSPSLPWYVRGKPVDEVAVAREKRANLMN